MDVGVTKDKKVPIDLTGGEYATCHLEIFVNNKLPIRMQRINTIHAVIENFLIFMTHDKIDELTSLVEDALDKLEEKK